MLTSHNATKVVFGPFDKYGLEGRIGVAGAVGGGLGWLDIRSATNDLSAEVVGCLVEQIKDSRNSRHFMLKIKLGASFDRTTSLPNFAWCSGALLRILTIA